MKNLSENLPIYIRITERVKDAILSGEIKEEGQLPSTTFMSKDGFEIKKTKRFLN